LTHDAKKLLEVAERELIYRWLAGLFANELSVDMLEVYADEGGQAFMERIRKEATLAPLVMELQNIVADKERYYTRTLELGVVYANVFSGALGEKSALPYESAYFGDKGVLYQQPTIEMLAILKKLGLSQDGELKEPPDHISVELSVMAELVMLEEATQQQIDFIDHHLLNWLPALRDDCMACEPDNFYGKACQVTVALLEKERAQLLEA